MHVGRIHNATTHGPAGQSSTRVTSTSEAQHAWPCCAPCISPRSGRWRRRHCCACCPLRPCWRTIFYTEKAPNAWHRRRTHRTGNTYNQPNRPNRLTSQTKHQALRWFTPLACGPGSPELSKSYMDMASKLFTFIYIYYRKDSPGDA